MTNKKTIRDHVPLESKSNRSSAEIMSSLNESPLQLFTEMQAARDWSRKVKPKFSLHMYKTI